MVIIDFIYMGPADLFGTGRERKIQNENMWSQRDSNPHHASPRQESQRLRPLGHAGWISNGTFIISQYSEMDMWQYLYGIGYGLIPNAKFCKQLLYIVLAKIYNEIRN